MSHQEDGRGLFSGTTVPRDRESYEGRGERHIYGSYPHEVPNGSVNPTPTPFSDRLGTTQPPRPTLLSRVADINTELEVLQERLQKLSNQLGPVSSPPKHDINVSDSDVLPTGSSELACELHEVRHKVRVLVGHVAYISNNLEI